MNTKAESGTPKPAAKRGGRQLTLKERIEDNLVLFTLSILAGGFLGGVGAYEGVLRIAQLETIGKQEIERLRKNPEIVSVTEKDRKVPKEVTLTKIESKPNWIVNLIHLFDIEGSFKKRELAKGSTGQPANGTRTDFYFGSDALEYNISEATKNFNWILTADSTYALTALGFRFDSNGKSFEPLDVQTTEKGDKITFNVPRCETGDKLILIVRVESSEELNMTNITAAFNSVSR